LLSLYLNDLKQFLQSKYSLGLNCITDEIENLLPSKVKLKLFEGNRPPAKIATFVLLEWAFSFHKLQYSEKLSSCICISTAESDKAIYAVLKKGCLHNLSIKCQYDLIDKIVKPILLYGCEIWGFSNLDIIERVHLKFCKFLLHLKNTLYIEQIAY
jgi:hypothetical protein